MSLTIIKLSGGGLGTAVQDLRLCILTRKPWRKYLMMMILLACWWFTRCYEMIACADGSGLPSFWTVLLLPALWFRGASYVMSAFHRCPALILAPDSFVFQYTFFHHTHCRLILLVQHWASRHPPLCVSFLRRTITQSITPPHQQRSATTLPPPRRLLNRPRPPPKLFRPMRDQDLHSLQSSR